VQANCPNCGNRIVIDDAKVPDRPFQVKCPKCQTMARFPGKAAAPAEAPAPDAAVEAPVSGEVRAQLMAQIRREMAAGSAGGDEERALVALPTNHASAMTLVLTRLGYGVDTFDDAAEGGRLLEQGVYDVVATARAAGTLQRESLYQRIARLGGDARRRIFLVLAGDEFKTGDGAQAWACQADLVVNSKDVSSVDTVFRSVLAERNRVYQAFLEARRRFEASGG